MFEQPPDATVTQQIELVIRRLDSLSILPSIAAQFLSKLQEDRCTTSDVLTFAEADPVTALLVYKLINQKQSETNEVFSSISKSIQKLEINEIRDAFLAAKIYKPSSTDDKRIELRKQLTINSVAAACSSRQIAEMLGLGDLQTAYMAGLLHNIGMFALDEAMPRSLTGVIEQAKAKGADICEIERKHLGIDHAILGKRLANKWQLPQQIVLAIWLHHNNAEKISQIVTEAKIAQIVQLACLISKQCGIGESGSYDSTEAIYGISQSLGLSDSQLDEICSYLGEKVEEKTALLGFDLENIEEKYSQVIRKSFLKSAANESRLMAENKNLQADASHFSFVKKITASINSSVDAIDIAERIAKNWQQFYQTSKVCLYLVDPAIKNYLKAVIVDETSQANIIALNTPDSDIVPRSASREFQVFEAKDYSNWLFNQLEVDFDKNNTKLVPLISGGKALGAIVFEMHYPVPISELTKTLEQTSNIAAKIIDLAVSGDKGQYMAEQFALLLSDKTSTPTETAETIKPDKPQNNLNRDSNIEALAEMAAGAAHEMNNPLSVISGRAQLLTEAETDPQKKVALERIQENSRELTAIIDDLMSFANPRPPRPSQFQVRQLIDEAIQLTMQKTGTEHINIQIKADENIGDLFVDSAQIVQSAANILCNSLESYKGPLGPIEIAVSKEYESNLTKLEIKDLGCGMDAQTLSKATHPFFSSLPAGRKRGMGLAHAKRLIQLNRGYMQIRSEPDKGTTVTILLPNA